MPKDEISLEDQMVDLVKRKNEVLTLFFRLRYQKALSEKDEETMQVFLKFMDEQIQRLQADIEIKKILLGE